MDYLKILKISIGCCLSVLLANALGLSSATSAGTITLLSIQNTKRETLSIASKRLTAFLIAVAAAYLSFSLLGFGVTSFGAFLFLFTLACYRTGLEAGLSMSTVLMTHIWAAQSMNASLMLNELCLLLIGVGMAVLINLYMPSTQKVIRADQAEVSRRMTTLLEDLARLLEGGRVERIRDDFAELEHYLAAAHVRAWANMHNNLARDTRYYVQLIDLRQEQCALLQKVGASLSGLRTLPLQARMVAALLRRIAVSFDSPDNAVALLSALQEQRDAFKSMELPQSREEFEARAVLFSAVSDIESLLLAKKRFADALTPEQKRSYWSAAERAR